MPVFQVTGPDGTTYRVNAPEGATQEQAIQYAQQNMQAKAPVDEYKREAEARPFLKRQMAGLATAPINTYLGVKQLFGDLSPVEQDVLKQNRAAEGAAPVASIASGVGTYAPAMLVPGANTVVGAGLTGAAVGAAQPVQGDESRVQNAVLSGLLGAGGQYAGQKAAKALAGRNAFRPNANANSTGGEAVAEAVASANPTMSVRGGGPSFGTVGDDASAGLTQAQQQALARGQGLGMQFTPGQATGSKALQQLEAKLESQPMTSGRFFEIKDNNQKVINRLTAKAIGESSDVVDSSVLEAAKDRIGNVYKMVANDKPRPINPDDFINRLSQVETEFEGLLPQNAPSIMDNPLVKKAYKLAEGGEATGRQLQDLASKLGRAANNQMTSASGDRQVGMALNSVKDQIDDLLEQGLTGSTLKQFQDARSQYRNLMLFTSRQGVINPSSGNVNPRSLAGVLQTKDKSGFLFNKNQNDLYSAVRASQAFPSVVGDSGTATRMPLQTPMDVLVSMPFNLATKAYTSAPALSVAANAGRVSREGLLPSSRPVAKYLPPLAGLLGATLPTQ